MAMAAVTSAAAMAVVATSSGNGDLRRPWIPKNSMATTVLIPQSAENIPTKILSGARLIMFDNLHGHRHLGHSKPFCR